MTPAERTSAGAPWRRWAVWGVPKRAYLYFFALELLAVVWSILDLAVVDVSGRDLIRFAVILGLAVLFEEGSHKAAQLDIRLSDSMHQDMTSVWTIPAALVLPGGLAAALIVVLYGYMWFREYRPSGRAPYRTVLSVAAVLVGSLSANAVVGGTTLHLQSYGWSWLAAGAVAAGVLIHASLNRGLITMSWTLRGMELRQLVGTWDENLLEYGTLCLGALVTISVAFEPGLTPLVLVPMIPLQRSALVRKLEEVATTDAKTGLLNAIGWENVAQRELTRAHREGTSLAMLMIDLDWFKRVNDRFGHLAGDAILRKVGEMIASELRGTDTVGRFGGEEYVAILPHTNEAAALATAERVRARVNAAPIAQLLEIDSASPDERLAVSIGVAISPTDGADVTELLHAADGALYYAKENGRNRVELARRGGDTVRPTVSV